jgi:hypothetical protein
MIGSIYNIESKQGKVFYIGSTFSTLDGRLQKHEGYLKEIERKTGFCLSHKVLKFPDYKISLVETLRCKSNDKKEARKELERREGWWIKLFRTDGLSGNEPSMVNRMCPARTREERLFWLRLYYERNKEKYNERSSIYYDCECGKKVRLCGKARHNRCEFHLKTLELTLNDEEKDFEEARRVRERERRKEKVICELCGTTSTLSHIKRHQRTKKCLDNRT